MPLNKAAKVPAWAQTQLDLPPETAEAVLTSLIAQQLVAGSEKGKTKKVTITQAGREALEQLAEFVPQPPPKKEKKPAVPKKSPAEVVAEKVRVKATGLADEDVVTDKALGKPGGTKVTEAQTQAFADTLAELLKSGTLHSHPGGKYGKRPAPTPAELVRKQVEETLATKEGPFTRAALSKPKKNASVDEKQAHDAALDAVIAELVNAKKLFPHSGGKYGQLREVTLADRIRDEVVAKLSEMHDTFKAADLSQPHADAKKKGKTAHAEALEQVVTELVEAKTLFRHPGGRLSKQPYVDPHRDLREVYVLHQFSRAPNRTITRADIELAFPGTGKPEKKQLEAEHPNVARFRGVGCFEMGAPATRATLAELVASGDLRHTGEADGGAYTLTDAGAKRLEQARNAYPVLPPVGDPATPNDAAMRELWEAFVLLRLTEASGFTAGESAVFVGGYKKGSKLNEATAWVLYGELAKAGHVTARWNGTEGEYTLTPKGLRHLAGLSFDGFPEVKVKGTALTALLSAARGEEKAAPAPTPTTPPPADLEAEVMDIFHRLLRERHANIRMVPIHEVRAEVRTKFGDRAASREVFNELLLDMRRAKKVRLVSITDPSRATEQQLQDSVFSVGETFFYMETAHAPVSGG